MRNKLQPKSDECFFILTDSDLYPQDNWTFVFGVTRPNLRTLVQSIARHDPQFPQIAEYRSLKHFFLRTAEMEGGAIINDIRMPEIQKDVTSPNNLDEESKLELDKNRNLSRDQCMLIKDNKQEVKIRRQNTGQAETSTGATMQESVMKMPIRYSLSSIREETKPKRHFYSNLNTRND